MYTRVYNIFSTSVVSKDNFNSGLLLTFTNHSTINWESSCLPNKRYFENTSHTQHLPQETNIRVWIHNKLLSKIYSKGERIKILTFFKN